MPTRSEIERTYALILPHIRVTPVLHTGGATALAALLSGAYQPAPNERVAVIVCGGNTTAVRFEISKNK